MNGPRLVNTGSTAFASVSKSRKWRKREYEKESTVRMRRINGAGSFRFILVAVHADPKSVFLAPLLLYALLTDRRSAPLQVGIADGAIEINGSFRDALEAVEVQRTFIDDIGCIAADARVPRDEVDIRSHGGIDQVADTVANGEWWQERQHKIGTRGGSPHAKSLTRVFVALLDTLSILGDIE